jgi:hypothetical protein
MNSTALTSTTDLANASHPASPTKAVSEVLSTCPVPAERAATGWIERKSHTSPLETRAVSR